MEIHRFLLLLLTSYNMINISLANEMDTVNTTSILKKASGCFNLFLASYYDFAVMTTTIIVPLRCDFKGETVRLDRGQFLLPRYGKDGSGYCPIPHSTTCSRSKPCSCCDRLPEGKDGVCSRKMTSKDVVSTKCSTTRQHCNVTVDRASFTQASCPGFSSDPDKCAGLGYVWCMARWVDIWYWCDNHIPRAEDITYREEDSTGERVSIEAIVIISVVLVAVCILVIILVYYMKRNLRRCKRPSKYDVSKDSDPSAQSNPIYQQLEEK